jgi:hypothetical protein
MKRISMMALILAIAATGFATEVTEEYGQWAVLEDEGSLLDDSVKLAFVMGPYDETLVVRFAPTVRVMVVFPDYLGLENEAHDEDVVFVTDKIEADYLADTGWRTGSSSVVWDGKTAQRLIDEVLRAEAVMFRTYDYRGNTVDALFEFDIENAVAAWEAVK